LAARLAQGGDPVWGYLNWVVLHPEEKAARTCVLVPGSCGPGTTEFSVVNPAGRVFHGPVDHILLHAFERTLDLSEIYRQISALKENFEAVLGPQFVGAQEGGSTFLITLDVTFEEEAGEPSS
jgi:hypothetical protein